MAAIGIDLGGTKIYGVRMKGAEVVADAKGKTPVQGGPMGVVDAIAKVVTELGAGEGDVIGVGAPGVIDVDKGVVRAAPNLPGWVEPFALGPALAETLGLERVVLDNDVNVGTVAEHRLGAGKGADELLGVFVGTGVGGGVVLDGKLRRGATGLAGEIGHVVVVPGGRSCSCGGRGHLEAYAGRAGMERRARALENKGHDTALVELARTKRMTSSVWAKALAAGDQVAIDLIDEAVGALGRAIAGVILTLDLRLVVVGGGLADRLGAAFVDRIEQAVRSDIFGGGTKVRVVAAELGDRAGAIGAALLATA
ncbi:MAG TPA: ROK family protein [Acidimicrobiales bacterium]|nr:ROK family protein [Acidimicrobiales bacterium]